MSTKAYSKDLRTRVIGYIEEGNTQLAASKLFHVSKSAVNRWWTRYIKEGSLETKPKLGSKGKVNQQDLENYVQAHPNKKLSEIGEAFKVSGVAIWKGLKKLGFSYKKKRSPMWKQMKKKETST